MNKNLYFKELKRNRKNLLIWTAIVLGFTFMVLSIFPSMRDMGQDMAQLMNKMPVELQKAFGLDANTWGSILGFYNTYYGIYIVVLISIFTTSTGATIISKEEKDRTAEFLLTRPLSRKSIVWTKIAALFTLSIIIFMVQTVAAVVGIMIFDGNTVNWGTFGTMTLHGFFLMLFFTCIGVLISMYVKPKKNFMGIVVGITFGTYFINALAKSTDTISWLGYASPFHYMDFTISDPDYTFNFLAALLMTIIGFGLLLFSWTTYNKKDIAT